ncbi:uncharacterized protein [Argopecten irradians]|uniref:uncharacterized protein n=1 Tax=Argopecten irradians TaxID=31199 RepID=UPI003716E36D
MGLNWKQVLQNFRFGTKTLDPEKEQSYTCPENSDIVVKFPAGTITTQENVFIQLEPVRESKVPLTEVRAYTDTVYIQHDQAFLKPVQVKIPLTRIEEVDLTSCELLCVHFEEDEISVNEDVKVELLPGNICSFETNQFPRNGVYVMKKTLRRSLKKNYARNQKATWNESSHYLRIPRKRIQTWHMDNSC